MVVRRRDEVIARLQGSEQAGEGGALINGDRAHEGGLEKYALFSSGSSGTACPGYSCHGETGASIHRGKQVESLRE